MSRETGVRLAIVLAKTICVFAFANPVAATFSGELIGFFLEGVSDKKQRQEIKHIVADIERLADDIAERILEQFGGEFRGLPEHERNAAILAVADSLEHYPISRDNLLALNLSPEGFAADVRRASVLVPTLAALNEAARALYWLVLNRTSIELMEALRELSEVQAAATTEILSRLQRLLNELVEKPEKVYGRVRLAEDVSFTSEYQAWAARRLGSIDLYCGITPSRPEQEKLENANIKIPATVSSQAYQSLEEAIAGRSSVFINGPRGSGKTSILRQLSVIAAREGFADPLQDWNGRIPFYIPLRRHDTFPAVENFLQHISCPISGKCPQGWIARQISSGSALIMMNGLDEIPVDRREVELQQLATFARFVVENGSVVLVTSRPGAVPTGWPESAGFSIVDVAPVPPSDVAELIVRWHTAVAAAELDSTARTAIKLRCDILLSALTKRSDLRELAANPLTAALICALHLDNRIHLPGQWLELIDLVIRTLADRDVVRRIPTPSSLSLENIAELERDLIPWTVPNAPNSTTREDISPRVEHGLKWIGHPEVTVRSALNDLLVRGSIFTVDLNEKVTFASEVLRDHVVAAEIITENNYGLAEAIAADPDWRRLILAIIFRADHDRAIQLLRRLLESNAVDSARDQLSLIAMIGIKARADLRNGALDTEIIQRVEDLILPPDEANISRLAAQGNLALDALAEMTAGSSITEAVMLAAFKAAIQIGLNRGNATAALMLVAHFAEDPRQLIQDAVWAAWPLFDRVEYARNVLRRCAVIRTEVTVDDPSVPAAVALLDEVNVMIVNEGIVDISPLRGRSNLTVIVRNGAVVTGEELLGPGSEVVLQESAEEVNP